jgi:hypothetical protein
LTAKFARSKKPSTPARVLPIDNPEPAAVVDEVRIEQVVVARPLGECARAQRARCWRPRGSSALSARARAARVVLDDPVNRAGGDGAVHRAQRAPRLIHSGSHIARGDDRSSMKRVTR